MSRVARGCSIPLKMLPVLKQQDVNILDFLQLFHTQNFVISFPIKSLSGKEKGMKRITSYGLNLLQKVDKNP